MTRVAINDGLWGVSLALQCVLLALVVARGVAARLPCFAVLLGFYPLRAAALFVLFGHVDTAAYAQAYETLSLAGLLLLLLAGGEIGLRLFRSPDRRFQHAAWIVPVLAWLATLGLWDVLPVRAAMPPDRLQMFGSFCMVLLFAWCLAESAPRLLRNAAAGLAVYGVVDLLATAGKAIAVAHRDARAYAGWSYASSAVYLAVVVYWMFTLRQDRAPGNVISIARALSNRQRAERRASREYPATAAQTPAPLHPPAPETMR